MATGNWVIDNLNNALKTWNDKLSEIWQIMMQSPTEFKGEIISWQKSLVLILARQIQWLQ